MTAATETGCAWPLWPHESRPPRPAQFCGAALAGNTGLLSAYCAHHAAAAVRSPEEREATALAARRLSLQNTWNKS